MIRSMSPAVADGLDRAANAVLGSAVLGIAGLITIAIRRRPARALEPLGVLFCVVLLAIGLRTWVHVLGPPAEGVNSAMVIADWIAACSALAFLALHRRYGLFVGSADIARDYEMKEREARALVQVNEELRRLDQLKSEFLAMVSHELRTPLTAIIGYSRLLMRQVHGTLSPKQVEHQEAIFRSAQRLTELINELLDVSRLEAGRVELAPRPTSVRHIADQAIAVVGVAAQAKQIRLENAVSADLPLVNADPTRLQQVLVNLVGNGVKFTPAGGRVTLSAGAHGDQVWLAVEDTGVGIPAEELARIWDPFYQVESPLSRRHGGSGLGLAIVRRLVELHGGVVRAESEGRDRGSRFTFTLPVALPAKEPSPEPEPALGPVLAGRRVLIVEDEHENQAFLRSIVEDVLGGKATISSDGEHALHEALEQPPALVLLDLMLPGVSGWEVARRLRQNPRTQDAAIIAVSALARTQEREAALLAGCDAYLAKPFTPEEMGRLIATALARHGAAA
jgi:signal transduction histidine kinase/ActR/RegA family two-component response regulator